MGKAAKVIGGAAIAVVGVVTANPSLIMMGATMSASALLAPKVKQQATQASIIALSMGETSREAVFGEVVTGGSFVDGFNYGGKYGTDQEALIISLADHECDSLVGFYVNDKYVAFTGDGMVAGYNNQLQVYFRSGTETQSLPSIVTSNAPGWTSADRGRGVCYVVVAYKHDEAEAKNPVWSSGRPTFRWRLKGKRCYDPRKDSTVAGGSGAHRWATPSTWEWSDNPIVCRYNWVRGVYACNRITDPTMLLIGRGLTAIEAPPENVFAPANLCDELVGGVKRYTVGGGTVIRADEAFIDVEEKFAAACAGVIIQPEGSVEIEPGQAKAPVAYITDADLVAGEKVEASDFLSQSDDEWFNTVVPRYVEPTQNWSDHAAPIRRVDADVIADTRPREEVLSLGYVTNEKQAGRVGEIRRRFGRLWKRRTITLGPRFADLEEGDWIVWTSQRYGKGVSVTYRAEAYALSKEWRNTLRLREIHSTVFAEGAFLPNTASATQPGAPPAIGAPAVGAWALSAQQLSTSGGAVPALVITGAADDLYAGAIRFEYWRSDGVTDPATVTNWTEAARGSHAMTRVEITSIAPGAPYYAAVSYVVDGIAGDRRIYGPVTAGTVTSAATVGVEAGATRNVYRGTWAAGLAYAVNDEFLHEGTRYRVTVAHTSAGGAPPPNGNVEKTTATDLAELDPPADSKLGGIAPNATADIAPISYGSAAVTVKGNTFSANVAVSTYQAAVRAQPFTGSQFAEIDINPSAPSTIVCLDNDATSTDYADQLVYAHYNPPTGLFGLRINGALVASGVITAGLTGKLALTYDKVAFRFFVAGVERGSHADASNPMLYPKWIAQDTTTTFTGLRSGPYTDNNFGSIGGATAPSAYATGGDTVLRNMSFSEGGGFKFWTNANTAAVSSNSPKAEPPSGSGGKILKSADGTGLWGITSDLTPLPAGSRRLFVEHLYWGEADYAQHTCYVYCYDANGVYLDNLQFLVSTFPADKNTWQPYRPAPQNVPARTHSIQVYLQASHAANRITGFRVSFVKAGADMTEEHPKVATADVGATGGENLVRNASLANGTNGTEHWLPLAATRHIRAAAGDPPAWVRATDVGAIKLNYNAAGPSEWNAVPAGAKKWFLSIKMRRPSGSSWGQLVINFYNANFSAHLGSLFLSAFPTGNGVWEVHSGTGNIPAGAAFYGVYLQPQSADATNYIEIAEPRIAATEDSATVGAPTGTVIGSTLAETVEARANDPAARINAHTTRIWASKAQYGDATPVEDLKPAEAGAEQTTGKPLSALSGRTANQITYVAGGASVESLKPAEAGAEATTGKSLTLLADRNLDNLAETTARKHFLAAEKTKVTGVEDLADVSRAIAANPAISIPADHNGTLLIAQHDEPIKLLKAGVVVTSGITWTYKVVSGTINGFNSASAAQSITGSGQTVFSTTTLATDVAVVDIFALEGGKTTPHRITVVKDKAAPPVSGGSGGGSGGTAASDNTLSGISSSTHAVVSDELIVTVGSVGSVTLSASITVGTAATGSAATYEVWGKWQWWNGSSWVDLTSETASNPDCEVVVVLLEEGGSSKWTEYGTLNVPDSKTGLTAGSSQKFRLLARNGSGTRAMTLTGTASAQG